MEEFVAPHEVCNGIRRNETRCGRMTLYSVDIGPKRAHSQSTRKHCIIMVAVESL